MPKKVKNKKNRAEDNEVYEVEGAPEMIDLGGGHSAEAQVGDYVITNPQGQKRIMYKAAYEAKFEMADDPGGGGAP